jgi:hypothetical protein
LFLKTHTLLNIKILIPEELFPFNDSARLFASTRFENIRFDFSAVIIFGDTACVIRRAHTEMRRAPEKLPESSCCDMTIIDALGFGVKKETGLTVSHVLAFLGSDSSNQVQRLYFLVTVHEPQPFSAMSPRDSISDDALEVKGDMWIEREIVHRCFKERGIRDEDGSINGAISLGLQLGAKPASPSHTLTLVLRPTAEALARKTGASQWTRICILYKLRVYYSMHVTKHRSRLRKSSIQYPFSESCHSSRIAIEVSIYRGNTYLCINRSRRWGWLGGGEGEPFARLNGKSAVRV